MKLEHLTNNSITNLYNELSKKLLEASDFAIATAFINDVAINLIETTLKKNKSLKNGRILIGLYNFFNKKKDLEQLLYLVNNYPDKLQVHISLDRCFHWKYYQFNLGRQQVFYIGSANFTASGMSNNRELVIKLLDNTKGRDLSLNNLVKSFEKEWVNSSPLLSFPLKYYKESKQSSELAGGSHKAIVNFFNQKTATSYQLINNGKTYAICLDSYAKQSTYKAIANQKDEWIKNDWDYFILPNRRDFDNCRKQKFVFVFLKEGRNKVYCYFSEVKDDESNIKTEDGNYFIAYKAIKKIELAGEILRTLRNKPYNINLIGWKNPFYFKVLGKRQTTELKKALSLNHSTDKGL